MEEEAINQISGANPIRSSGKKWIIVGIIVLSVLVLFFISRMITGYSSAQKNKQQVESAIYNMLSSSSRKDSSYQKINLTSVSQAREVILGDKNYVLNQINSLRSSGKADFYISNKSIICKDGVVISPEDYQVNGKFCSDGTMLRREGEGVKIASNNGSQAVLTVVASSLLISLRQYLTYVLEESENIESNTEASAATLDVLSYLSKQFVLYTTIKGLFAERFSNNTDARDMIRIMDRVNTNLEIPSESDIQNINLKQGCLDMFKQISSQQDPGFNLVIKPSIFERLFLIFKAKSAICGELELYQKNNALKMLADVRTEQNPVISINSKLYLNLFVKCSNEWYYGYNDGSSGASSIFVNEETKKETPCSLDYLAKFKNDFRAT